MQSRVEIFEQIRRDHELHGLSIRELARRHGVHRRAVRQALQNAIPPAKRAPRTRPAPALGPYRTLIDGWLKADLDAPRKQRHTARRIWERLRDEHGAEVAERTVREYVAKHRRALGLSPSEGCVPLCHEPGGEAEVDWGEARAKIAGQEQKVYLFLMRSCFSGASYCQAFERQTQQAFLEAHVSALEFFAGSFALLRYDNLRSAVAKVLKGSRRQEQERFLALRSHYLFESSFTQRGQAGAHEKGGVEGEVGRFRRSHLVPVPDVDSLAALNERLSAACLADLQRIIRGKAMSVGDALAQERALLRALPAEPFQSAEDARVRVSAKALATVRQNQYSLPVALIGLNVQAKIGASEVAFFHGGHEIARHRRLQGRFGISAKLDHYLELLRRKPGALPCALPLRQERERGSWPECFDSLWQAIQERTCPTEAARQMVDVLFLVREHGAEQTELAVRGALTAGAYDGRAVALLARRAEHRAEAPLSGLDESLPSISRPAPSLEGYDRLLRKGGAR
jgi:transposase